MVTNKKSWRNFLITSSIILEDLISSKSDGGNIMNTKLLQAEYKTEKLFTIKII